MPLAATAHLLAQAGDARNLLDVMDETCRLLRDMDGIPIDRFSWSCMSMHPEVRGFQGIWRTVGGAQEVAHQFDDVDSLRGFERSPLAPLHRGEKHKIRCSLALADDIGEFEILGELKRNGYTDYLALMMPCSNPFERMPITFATQSPGGFQDAHVDSLESFLPLLTLILQREALRRGARTLLETYLGRDPATHVLDGHIRRGEMVQMKAAVCFCDLRNFTYLSQTLDAATLLGLLHDAFDAVVSSLNEHEGEVLKFIGDAVLAVFPVDPQAPQGARLACERALRSAKETLARVAAQSDRRAARDLPRFEMGMAIHYGDVYYGNVGAPNRLDFTVIGATVNVASRLEGMCRTLGYPIVLSSEAARYLPDEDVVDAGKHVLKGVIEPVQIFGTHPLVSPAATEDREL